MVKTTMVTYNYNFEHLCQPLKFPEGMSELGQVYRDMKSFDSDGDVNHDGEWTREYLGRAFGLSREMVDKYLLHIECFDDEDKS